MLVLRKLSTREVRASGALRLDRQIELIRSQDLTRWRITARCIQTAEESYRLKVKRTAGNTEVRNYFFGRQGGQFYSEDSDESGDADDFLDGLCRHQPKRLTILYVAAEANRTLPGCSARNHYSAADS